MSDRPPSLLQVTIMPLEHSDSGDDLLIHKSAEDLQAATESVDGENFVVLEHVDHTP